MAIQTAIIAAISLAYGSAMVVAFPLLTHRLLDGRFGTAPLNGIACGIWVIASVSVLYSVPKTLLETTQGFRQDQHGFDAGCADGRSSGCAHRLDRDARLVARRDRDVGTGRFPRVLDVSFEDALQACPMRQRANAFKARRRQRTCPAASRDNRRHGLLRHPSWIRHEMPHDPVSTHTSRRAQ